MRWGGLTLLLFIVWHLLNFTIGKVNVTGGPTDDPYDLLVDSFQIWWLTVIYLVAMAALGDAPAARRVERRADPRPDQQRRGPAATPTCSACCSRSSSPAASRWCRSSRCSESSR